MIRSVFKLPASALVRRGWALAVLVALPALAPLLRQGFWASDDGRFHVYRLAALAAAWGQGVLHPRLFPQFGFGYGQAVLNFYSPAGYWPGALLSWLGFSPAAAAEITIAIGFLLAALAVFGCAQALWGAWAGLAAAAVYTYFPYHLADAYLRGALPEHLAFIFPPLIFWAYAAAFERETAGADHRPAGLVPSPAAIPPLLAASLALAALALVHHLSSLLLAPVVLAFVLALAASGRQWRLLAGVGGSLALAVGLSAGYWLPALVERSSVGLAAGASRGFEHHLLEPTGLVQRSWAYLYPAAGGYIVYPLSWLTATLPLVVLLLLILRWRGNARPAHTPQIVFHLGLFAVTVFLITTASLWLWFPLTPVLGQLQYPWRFLILTAVALAVVAAAIIPLQSRLRPALVVAVVAAAALVVGMGRLSLPPLELPAGQVWSPQRMWDEDAAAGQVGATWTGEFLPATVSEQRWALGRRREGASDGPALTGPLHLRLVAEGLNRWQFEVETPTPLSLRLHQFHQPGWNARIDGRPAAAFASGELGLVTVDIPPGLHQVALRFGSTPARLAGALTAFASTLLWAGLAWRQGRKDRALRSAAALLPILALALALNGLGIGRRTHTPQPIQAQLADVAQLIGWEARPGREAEALDVTLYWLALRDAGVDYKVFVHLLDGNGQVVSQHDGDPVGGYTPTTRWRRGEIIADSHRIPLPAGTAAGEYGLKAGMYELTAGGPANLPVEPFTVDGRIELGTVEVK
jgi:hypothetical protein